MSHAPAATVDPDPAAYLAQPVPNPLLRPILGIDPGLHGALALYIPTQPGCMPNVATYDMPTVTSHGKLTVDAPALATLVDQLIHKHPDLTAIVEQVSSRPRQAGAFQFGFYTGIVHGVLAAYHVPVDIISSTVWKRAIGLARTPGESYDDNKARARRLAAQLFPHAASQFARAKDDGRAEALLLAFYKANFTSPRDPAAGLPLYE